VTRVQAVVFHLMIWKPGWEARGDAALEGTAVRTATGLENQGDRKVSGSTPLPSAY